MALKIAYATSGCLENGLRDVFELLRGAGYDGVALSVGHGHLHALHSTRAEVVRTAEWLRHFGLECVVEADGRYAIDPRRPYRPSLVESRGSSRRAEFLRRAIEIGEALGARVVTFSVDAGDSARRRDFAWTRLAKHVADLGEAARRAGLRLAVEPRSESFLSSFADVTELRERSEVGRLGTTIDFLSAAAGRELDASSIEALGDHILHVRARDLGEGGRVVPIGEGTIAVAPLFLALESIRYPGLVSVDLERFSSTAPQMIAESMDTLRTIAATGAANRE